MVKSSIVKKFVTLGVAGAMAISTLGASVASATDYTNVDGGRWMSYAKHVPFGPAIGFATYYHPAKKHSVSVKAGVNGKVYSSGVKNARLWAAVQHEFYGADWWKTIYTNYKIY